MRNTVFGEGQARKLRDLAKAGHLAQPEAHVIPTGDVLVHHLQIVDSKRLKSPTHSVDRTAVTFCCVAGSVRLLCSGLLNRRTRVRLQVVARVKALQSRSNTLRRELFIFRAPL